MTEKYSRHSLLKSGCRVIEKVGFDGLTARAVAKEGKISTQPIYLTFHNMHELREEVKHYLLEEIRRTYFKKNHSLFNFLQNYLRFVQERANLYFSMTLTKGEIHLQSEEFFHHLLKESMASEEKEISDMESRLLFSRINGTMIYLMKAGHPQSEELLNQLVLQDIQLIKEWWIPK